MDAPDASYNPVEGVNNLSVVLELSLERTSVRIHDDAFRDADDVQRLLRRVSFRILDPDAGPDTERRRQLPP